MTEPISPRTQAQPEPCTPDPGQHYPEVVIEFLKVCLAALLAKYAEEGLLQADLVDHAGLAGLEQGGQDAAAGGQGLQSGLEVVVQLLTVFCATANGFPEVWFVARSRPDIAYSHKVFVKHMKLGVEISDELVAFSDISSALGGCRSQIGIPVQWAAQPSDATIKVLMNLLKTFILTDAL
eukprot:828567-Amphidinium_carterae.1